VTEMEYVVEFRILPDGGWSEYIALRDKDAASERITWLNDRITVAEFRLTERPKFDRVVDWEALFQTNREQIQQRFDDIHMTGKLRNKLSKEEYEFLLRRGFSPVEHEFSS
jgi:hypothetical protein